MLCSTLEGRRVYTLRRPSRDSKKKYSANAEADVPRLESADVQSQLLKKLGKVRACLFHPSTAAFVGVLIKRPDVLWMFHRKDQWSPRCCFDLADKTLVIKTPTALGLGSSWQFPGDGEKLRLSQCVIWRGLEVLSESGESLGRVGDVEFDLETGAVTSLIMEESGAPAVLLGSVKIPGRFIRGFRRGVGSELYNTEGQAVTGAIMVDDAALELNPEGGLAESAGKAAAVVAHKATQTINTLKPKATAVISNVKEKISSRNTKETVDNEAVGKRTEDSEASSAPEEADSLLERGSRAVGRQLKDASHMFQDFLVEYHKGRNS